MLDACAGSAVFRVGSSRRADGCSPWSWSASSGPVVPTSDCSPGRGVALPRTFDEMREAVTSGIGAAVDGVREGCMAFLTARFIFRQAHS